MFDFEKPRIEIAEISEDKRFGRFVVEPLERGYGTTLGNSLRRIMLSSLPGSAVSQIKIDGVVHEFSVIPVKEDVTEIVLNVKNLAIKNHSDTNEPKIAYIEKEGEVVVTAGIYRQTRILRYLTGQVYNLVRSGKQVIYGTDHNKRQRICKCGQKQEG